MIGHAHALNGCPRLVIVSKRQFNTPKALGIVALADEGHSYVRGQLRNYGTEPLVGGCLSLTRLVRDDPSCLVPYVMFPWPETANGGSMPGGTHYAAAKTSFSKGGSGGRRSDDRGGLSR